MQEAVNGSKVFWLSLDGRVADPDARALLARAADAEVGVDAILARLTQAGRCWLVVDGIRAEAHEGLAGDLIDLAAYLPDNARLLIGSHRRFPVLSKAVQIGGRDLAFTPDESMALLGSLHPDIDVDDAQSVIDLAQGWASALVAAASQLRSDGDPGWLGKAGAAALFDGWFSSLPEEERSLLLETSVLHLLSGDVAAAVAQRADAGRILLALDAGNAFLQEVEAPAGMSGRWWRRHRLLTVYLDDMAGTDRLRAHSRAADWFTANEDVPAAMHHLIAAGRNADAGDFLFSRESRLLSAEPQDVLRWYEAVSTDPDEFPVHLLRLAWGQAMSGEIVAADSTRARLRAHMAISHADEVELPASSSVSLHGEVALLEAYLAGFHADPVGVVKGARRRLLEPTSTVQPQDGDQLTPILLARGLLWAGQPEAAAQSLAAIADQPFPNDVLRETQLASVRALVNLVNGYVRRGSVQIEAVQSWMASVGMPPDLARFGGIWTAVAMAALEAGDLDRAAELSEQVAAAAMTRHMLAEAVYAEAVLARTQLSAEDYQAAAATLREARELATRDTPRSAMLGVVDELQARVHLCAGDPVRAERLIRGLPRGDQRSLLWVRLGLTRQPAVARSTLEGLSPSVPRLRVERHLLFSVMHLRSSRAMAEGHLRKAAAIAHEQGLGQALATFDAPLLEFAHAVAGKHQDDNLNWLLAFRAAAPSSLPSAVKVSLSRGELQLLGLLPTRAKNADIAAELSVSVNTIKTRLRRLYLKLGVSSRDEAIAAARGRGLL